MEVTQSAKLANVCYDIRGPVLQEAKRMEAEGHHVLKLNIGNPAPFGFEAPEEMLQDVILNLPNAHGYGDSKGLLSARRAVVQYYQSSGVGGVDIEDVWLGNGVSELIVMALQALLNNGDEVLVPTPDYPLWTAAVSLCGGRAVHYRCDESADWQPDLDDIAAKITPRTKAHRDHQPEQPDRRRLRRANARAARRARPPAQPGALLRRDLRQDPLRRRRAHLRPPRSRPDLLCLTFNGLSKAYRVAGFRTGWMVVSGPSSTPQSYIEGLDILANMRLCPNVPTQYAVQTALGGYQSINDLVLPGGRLLDQRDVAWKLLNEIPGVSCVKPKGALYAFPRLDPEVYPIHDDERFVLDLLRAEKLLVVQGTGFNWHRPDHFRVVTLPRVADLEDAIGRIARFLSTYTQ